MMQAVSESSGRAVSAYPKVRWNEVGDGCRVGRIGDSLSAAAVINHGYAVDVFLTFPGGELKAQEFRTVQAAQAAAEQWLTQIV